MVALLLTVALSTSVLGASVSAYRITNRCVASGGTYGYGYVVLKVAAAEYGRSGVNKIKFSAFLLRSRSAAGPWNLVDLLEQSTPYFGNTAADHGWTFNSRWDLGSIAQSRYHRIETTIGFWKTDGTNRLIGSRLLISKSC